MTDHPRTASRLSAGTARREITPSDLAGLNPFGADFTAVHDPLHARALVLDDGTERAALVTLDLVEVGDTTAIRQRIEDELDIAASRVMLAPSHAHNAPRIGLVPAGGKARIPTPHSLRYTDEVYDIIVATLAEAIGTLGPVTMEVGTEAVDVNVNREVYRDGKWGLGHSPEGVSDKTLTLVTLRDEATGAPRAVVMNYAVHSTVMLGVAEVSADLAGATAAHVEGALGPGAMAFWTSGALGDQAPKVQLDQQFGAPPERAAENRRFAIDAVAAQGFLLGATAVRLVRQGGRVDPCPRMRAGLRVIPCPVRRLPVPPGMEQAEVPEVDLTLACIVLGPVAIAGVSGEVTVPVARAVAAASPVARTLIVSNANARIGYLPADESYLRRTQAAEGCPIVEGHAARSIVDGLAGLIHAAVAGTGT